VLVQSSSAAVAMTLTAAAGGALALEPAAAVVIGANLGTTATAVLATLGATANAKRVASAHVLFNLVTGAIALAVLPLMLRAVTYAQDTLDLAHDLPTTLALFHTTFNLLGVILVTPWSRRLAAVLERRFTSQEEDLARPRHLDATTLAVPQLALASLAAELDRLHRMALDVAAAALGPPPAPGEPTGRVAVHALAATIRGFVDQLSRAPLPPAVAMALPDALRATQHAEDVADLALRPGTWLRLDSAHEKVLAMPVEALLQAAREALEIARGLDGDGAALAAAEARVEQRYAELKTALLAAASTRQLAMVRMDALTREAGELRHRALRAIKLARRLRRLATGNGPATPAEARTPADPAPLDSPAVTG
jgi:phosphate:Na+ symporter